MEHTVRVRAELILSNLAERFKNEHPTLVSSTRFATYETHYSLIFNIGKYDITTTIKLTKEFSLIGVFTWIPKETMHVIKDPQDAKARLNTRFQTYAEAIALPALRRVGAAA